MKKLFVLLCILVPLPVVLQAADITPGDFLVVRVGDGATALVNSAGPLSILEINPLGQIVQSFAIPSGDGGLQISGSATSEGQLVRNADGSSWTLAGYVPPFTGSGSLSGRSGTAAPRGYITLISSGVVSATTALPSTAYSGQNIRSGISSGSSVWFAGSGTASGNGVTTYDGSTVTTVQGVNSRVLNLNSGDLFYSTGSGTQGIYRFSGAPTSATTATPFLTGIAGQGTSPYDFTFSPDGNTLYVADDAIGVQKFTFDGTSWSLAYNFTSPAASNKAYGLAVDFTGANPVLYWTTPTDIYSATDSGSAASGTSILSAGTDYAFRGLDMSASAVPEPSVLALLAAGGVLWVVSSAKKKAALK